MPGLFLDQQNEQQPELPPEQVTAKTGNGISQAKPSKEKGSKKQQAGSRRGKGQEDQDQDVRKDEDELTK